MLAIISISATIIAAGLIWFLVVAPAEKRDHQRKLDIVQERLRKKKSDQMTEQ